MSDGPFSRRRLIQAIAALRGDFDTGAIAAQMRLGISSGLKTQNPIAAGDLFVVTGQVLLVHLHGIVTTVLQTQTNSAKLIFDSDGTGTSTDLCAALDLTAAAVGSYLSITGVAATAMAKAAWRAQLMTNPVILQQGVIELSTAASNTGAIDWECYYIPLSSDGLIAAA